LKESHKTKAAIQDENKTNLEIFLKEKEKVQQEKIKVVKEKD